MNCIIMCLYHNYNDFVEKELIAMLFKPHCLSRTTLSKEELVKDRKNCRKFGPCGVGEKAIYLNSFYFDRRYYIPLSNVKRIFKRVAMSKGGFTGKGLFATIPYLVVVYDNGEEKQCNFKFEENVDSLLAYIKQTHPYIRLHSEEAEKRLKQKERLKEQKKAVAISKEAKANVAVLNNCMEYLNRKEELSIQLSAGAKRKRVYDRSNPAYKWVALSITLLGAAALIYGIFALITHAGFAVYFLLFGLAAIFLFSSANVLPTAKNNKKYIESHLMSAVEDMEEYIHNYPDFPIPAWYAHPVVLKRMIDIIEEGRAVKADEALEVLKSDLKALNSSVAVEQEEYDEIMAIKPMFLVREYQ